MILITALNIFLIYSNYKLRKKLESKKLAKLEVFNRGFTQGVESVNMLGVKLKEASIDQNGNYRATFQIVEINKEFINA